MSNYDALLALAQAATPGPWIVLSHSGDPDEVWTPHGEYVAGCGEKADVVFIAACSPDVVTALIYQAQDMLNESKVSHAEHVANEALARLATLEAAARYLVNGARQYREHFFTVDTELVSALNAVETALAAPPPV